MAERDDGLDPLLLDTIVRAHVPSVLLGLVVALALPLAALGVAGRESWWLLALALTVAVLVANGLVRRATRIERDLAAVLDEP